MKTYFKPLKWTSVFIFISTITFGQVAVVDYMKVDFNSTDQYLEVEEQWKKIHQERLKRGDIVAWELFQVYFQGADSEYNYVTVNVYENFKKLNQSFSEELVTEVLPDLDIDEFFNKTNESRTLVKTEVYSQVSSLESDVDAAPGVFINVSYMNVPPGGASDYEDLENEVWKPMHAEAQKMGVLNGWGIWNRWPRNDNDYQYVAVNEYPNFENIGNIDFEELFNKAHPGKNADEILSKTSKKRTMVKSQIWELLDIVSNDE